MIPTRDEQVVLLCGGLGLRMRGAGLGRPKPLVKIGERPILWHLMKFYSHYGFRRFILLLGYKGTAIVDYFDRYNTRYRDFTMRLGDPDGRQYHTALAEDEADWHVTFIQCGVEAATAGRLLCAAPYIQGDRFLANYSDGLGDIDIPALLTTHDENGLEGTVTSTRLPGSFGILSSEGARVTGFQEKPVGECEINAGFFVFNRSIFSRIRDEASSLEADVLPAMSTEGRLAVFRHTGFWRCMDTPKQAEDLNAYWADGEPPWKLW